MIHCSDTILLESFENVMKTSFSVRCCTSLLAISVLLSGCGADAPANPATFSGPFAGFVKDIELFDISNPLAVVETDQGTFAIELYERQVPDAVRHFGARVAENRYTDSAVYNVVGSFAAYMGDKSGLGKDDTLIAPLALQTHPDLYHDAAGVVGFVRETGTTCVSLVEQEQCLKNALNSSRSLFYITLAPQPSLDNSYVAFGKVIKGLEIVRNLKKGNKIQAVTIVRKGV